MIRNLFILKRLKMIELTIGSRFWYGDKLCEVCEGWCDNNDCNCVLWVDMDTCEKAKCMPEERRDGKKVYFKIIEINENTP